MSDNEYKQFHRGAYTGCVIGVACTVFAWAAVSVLAEMGLITVPPPPKLTWKDPPPAVKPEK